MQILSIISRANLLQNENITVKFTPTLTKVHVIIIDMSRELLFPWLQLILTLIIIQAALTVYHRVKTYLAKSIVQHHDTYICAI